MNIKLAMALGLAIAMSSPVYAADKPCVIKHGKCRGPGWTPLPPRCKAICQLLRGPLLELDRKLGRK